MGSDETLGEIGHHLPSQTRFIGYGHRLSFGYVAHEVISGFQAKKIVARAAADVIAWDQLGCRSPHVIYVEHGGGTAAPADKTLELATQLARWGVTRICPLGQMQNPPLTWRHDGRGTLSELVTWSNWEQ